MDEFMRAAIREAQDGADAGGIPIGAALVDTSGRLVATGHNRRLQDDACIMHAEINCLYNAGKTIQDFRGMTMYSTLMPCHMCAGAMVQFGIAKVVAAESDNFSEQNGRALMERHDIEVIDLDLEAPKRLLHSFIASNQQHWNRDIGR